MEETTTSTQKTTTIQTIERQAVKVLQAKQLWLDWAEITDAWRVVPRSILYPFGAWTIYTCDRVLTWYFNLPADKQTTQNAMLVGSIFTAVTGLFTLALGFYQRSGRQWAGQPPPQ